MGNSLYHRKPKSDRKHTRKRRCCLMCWKLFMSAWPGQRICPTARNHVPGAPARAGCQGSTGTTLKRGPTRTLGTFLTGGNHAGE